MLSLQGRSFSWSGSLWRTVQSLLLQSFLVQTWFIAHLIYIKRKKIGTRAITFYRWRRGLRHSLDRSPLNWFIQLSVWQQGDSDLFPKDISWVTFQGNFRWRGQGLAAGSPCRQGLRPPPLLSFRWQQPHTMRRPTAIPGALPEAATLPRSPLANFIQTTAQFVVGCGCQVQIYIALWLWRAGTAKWMNYLKWCLFSATVSVLKVRFLSWNDFTSNFLYFFGPFFSFL